MALLADVGGSVRRSGGRPRTEGNLRGEFISAVLDLAARDERVVLLTGDLGFTVVEEFAGAFPERFFNVGVAEQNMLGVATGLAEAGFVPFAYSIATFATMRPYEFFRNGALLHELPVRLVGVGGGLDYGHNGITHFALEDVALMRVQPGLTIVAPADAGQAQAAVAATSELPGPIYFRLGRLGHPIEGVDSFGLGQAVVIGPPADVVLFALGPAAREAVAASQLLAVQGVAATVAVVSSFNPSPDADVLALLDRASLAVTVEGHYRTGALGSYICELAAEHSANCRVVRCGVDRMPRGVTGSTEYLQHLYGLSPAAIAAVATDSVASGRPSR